MGFKTRSVSYGNNTDIYWYPNNILGCISILLITKPNNNAGFENNTLNKTNNNDNTYPTQPTPSNRPMRNQIIMSIHRVRWILAVLILVQLLLRLMMGPLAVLILVQLLLWLMIIINFKIF
jgi:hypothetical protein